MTVLAVTGTDTGVGKTVTTAALACAARLARRDVAVCKPVQTGTIDGDDDLGEVRRLSGVTALHGGWRYPEPRHRSPLRGAPVRRCPPAPNSSAPCARSTPPGV